MWCLFKVKLELGLIIYVEFNKCIFGERAKARVMLSTEKSGKLSFFC